MATPLTICTRQEQQAMTKFMWAERCWNLLQTISMIWWHHSATMKHVPNKCHWWMLRAPIHTSDWKDQWTNPCADSVIISGVVKQLQISHSYAHEIIHNRLHFHKVCDLCNSIGITVWTLCLPFETVLSWGRWHLSGLHCYWWWNMDLPLWAEELELEYGMETPNILCLKEVQIFANSRKSDTLFWDSEGQVLEHYQQWGVMGRCMMCWSQWVRVNTENNCHIALCFTWQCPSPYCYQHCSNTPAAALWGPRTFTVQPWLCPVRLSFLWTPQKCFKRLSFCHGPQAEGGSAYMASILTESIFLCAMSDKVCWMAGGLCWKDTLVSSVLLISVVFYLTAYNIYTYIMHCVKFIYMFRDGTTMQDENTFYFLSWAQSSLL